MEEKDKNELDENEKMEAELDRLYFKNRAGYEKFLVAMREFGYDRPAPQPPKLRVVK